MSRVVATVFVLAAVLAAGTGGYWLAQERAGVLTSGGGQPAQQPSGPVIYYQDPDGKPSYSAEPKRTADGRPYRAVYASEDVSFDEPRAASGDERAGRQEDSLLPPSDGFARCFQGTQEGLDGDGLHPGLRGRGRRQYDRQGECRQAPAHRR